MAISYEHMNESFQEFLAHHGVKGMHWGVRKAKPTSAEIHDARQRQADRQDRFIENDRNIRLAKTAKERAAAVKKQDALIKDFATSEDRVTAARVTKGEKIAQALLLGPFALITIPAGNARAKKVAAAVDEARKVK